MKKVGDKLYQVVGVINYNRTKYTFVDDNGVEWFRYDEPFHKIVINEYTITGIAITTVEGATNPTYPNRRSIAYLSNDSCFYEPLTENVFTDESEAQAYMKVLNENS